MKLQELLKKHPRYEKHIDEWNFLKVSYEGGQEYEDAQLLWQYTYEKLKNVGDLNAQQAYRERLQQTPLDNQCESAISTYTSYIWRRRPQRDLGKFKQNQQMLSMLEDCDFAGTSLDEFMRQVQEAGHVYGHCWIMVDKPEVKYKTLAQELKRGIRPYLVRYIPQQIWNWEYQRGENGQFELTYIKICETDICRNGKEKQIIRIWTKEIIEIYEIIDGKLESETPVKTIPNALGIIPIVCHYSRKIKQFGIGCSDIKDIARMQCSIYNDLSELHQTIRITNHNTLVKNKNDNSSAGAGGVIIMDDETDPQKKPYLLQPQIFSLTGLIQAIQKKTDMINWMAHTAPVKNQRNTQVSGEALKTEFQLLNSLLNEIAAGLKTTEIRVLKVFTRWLGRERDFYSINVVYPMKFELRDTKSELELLKEAKALDVQSQEYRRQIDKQIATITLEEDDKLESINAEIDKATYAMSDTTPTA